MNSTKFKSLAAGALFALAAGSASAAAGYCSGMADSDATKHVDGNSTFLTSDVTFNTVNADDCYGIAAVSGGLNPDNVLDFANNTGLWTPNPWATLVRDVAATAGGTSSSVIQGYTFTLTPSGTTSSGTWDLTVTSSNLLTSPIPFQMDFAVSLHGGGGNNIAYYFFDDRTINLANSGTFKISILNQNNRPGGLSNFDILYRDITETGCTTPGGCNPQIPEPATLALVGAALVGLGVTRRRRKLDPSA